jgi:hypothetical protein
MKKILSFLFLLYTISVQALTITNDKLGGTYPVTVGETITVLEKDGYPDEPMWTLPFGFIDTWELTANVAGLYRFSYGGKITSIEVYPASIAVTNVSLSPSSLSGTIGGTGSLTATVEPSNATDKSVTWESSDTSVATVTDGTVNYTGAGTATITVKTNDGNHTATAAVNVTSPVYPLTVIGGIGGGNYAADTQVPVEADTPDNGKVFDRWTSDSGGNFADATSAATTFTMPPNAATVTATYKDAPATTYTLTVINGNGGGNYTAGTQVPIVANTPDGGKVFDKWTSDSGGSFTDANSATTTFTMPPNAATAMATYKDAPTATYALTVINGNGDGNYAADTQVPITANTPDDGKVFDRWTSDSGGSFTDANSVATTFTMPANAATVTATYKDAPATTYALTVIGGSGDGNYAADTQVPIVANTPANGKIFDKWTSNSGSFADATSAATTFTMPANAATVTATYKDAPASVYTLTVINGSGSGNYTAGTSVPIVANTPASGKIFDQWTSNGGSFANATSAATTFTMPSAAATVTATYKDDIPDGIAEASDNELFVRGIEKALYIKSPKDGTAYIHTITGRLIKTVSYPAGETTINLPAGIYIVRTAARTFRAYIK